MSIPSDQTDLALTIDQRRLRRSWRAGPLFGLLNTGRPLPKGRVGQLVEIITAKQEEEQQDDTTL
jgi:hypothetical protein